MDLSHETRLVARTIARSPGLAVVVVLTLGLAIGANAAIFSLIDRVALRPLPVEKPDELVSVTAPALPFEGPGVSVGGGKLRGMSVPLSTALHDGLPHLFSAWGVSRHWRFTLAVDPAAVEIWGDFVNADYFRVYGLRPVIGRTFGADEDRAPAATPVAVLNHAFWTQQFGGDRSILGRTIRLNQVPVTVVGVLGPGFTGSDPARSPQVFLPLAAADLITSARGGRSPFVWDSPTFAVYIVVARLAAGIDRARADQDLRARHAQLLADAVAGGARLTEKNREYYATNLPELVPAGTVGSLELPTQKALALPLRLLLGMTGFVLLIAAGNVANLLMARGAARGHEVAVSFALGARRWHLLRPLLVESLLLAAASAGLGLTLASWTGSLVPALLGLQSELAGVSTAPDRRVVVFTLGVSLVVGLFVWFASAFTVTRRGRRGTLLTGGGAGGAAGAAGALGPGGRFGLGLRRGLVVLQVALSLVLLCASVLLARSLFNVLVTDPGFDARSLVAFTISPGGAGHEGERRQRLVDEVVAAVRAVPGVSRAAASSMLPLGGGLSGSHVHGPRQAAGRSGNVMTDIIEVGDGFFETMGLAVVEGRAIDGRDRMGAPRVALVNESLAHLLVDEGVRVGRRIGYEYAAADLTIVGVVGDIRARSLKAPAAPTLYLPAAQSQGSSPVHVLARVATPGALTAAAATRLVGRLDRGVAVGAVESVERLARSLLLRERMLAAFSVLFAGLSALLAAMGLFGVTSFSVRRRAREIAVRMALGASRAAVARLVLAEIGVLVLVGSGLGLGLFLAASRVLDSLLFGISANDPAAIATAVAVLAVAASLAGALPARRAARLDPAVTLRSE